MVMNYLTVTWGIPSQTQPKAFSAQSRPSLACAGTNKGWLCRVRPLRSRSEHPVKASVSDTGDAECQDRESDSFTNLGMYYMYPAKMMVSWGQFLFSQLAADRSHIWGAKRLHNGSDCSKLPYGVYTPPFGYVFGGQSRSMLGLFQLRPEVHLPRPVEPLPVGLLRRSWRGTWKTNQRGRMLDEAAWGVPCFAPSSGSKSD